MQQWPGRPTAIVGYRRASHANDADETTVTAVDTKTSGLPEGTPQRPRTSLDEDGLYDYCDEDMNEVFREIDQVSATTIEMSRGEAGYASTETVTATSDGNHDEGVPVVAQAKMERALTPELAAKGEVDRNGKGARLQYKGTVKNMVRASVGRRNFPSTVAQGDLINRSGADTPDAFEDARSTVDVREEAIRLKAVVRLRTNVGQGSLTGPPAAVFGKCVEYRAAIAKPEFTAADVATKWIE